MNKNSSPNPSMGFISFDTPQTPEEPISSTRMGCQPHYTIETENTSNSEPLGSTPTANNESNLSERRPSDPQNDISSMWEILRRASMSNEVKHSVPKPLPCNSTTATTASSNDASAESLTDIPYDNHTESNRSFIVGDSVLWIAENQVAEEGIVAWVGEMDSEPTAGIIFQIKETPVGNNEAIIYHDVVKQERYSNSGQIHGRFLPVNSLIHLNDDVSMNSRQNRISHEVSAYLQDLFAGSNSTDPLKSTNAENVETKEIVTEKYCDTLAVATRPSSSQHCKSNSIAVGINSLGIHEQDRHTIKSEDIHRRKSDVAISHTSNISTNFQPPVTLGCIPSGLKLSDRVVWINDKEPVEGTVKWIGKIRGHFHAGVELDKPVGNSSGLYAYGNGLSMRLFTSKLTYGRFIPADQLILYTDCIPAEPDSQSIQHVSLEQYLPNNDSHCENSYGQMVAGNNIGDLLGLNDSDPIGESTSSSEMESEIPLSLVQQSDTKEETKAKLERIFSRRHSSTTVRYPIRETIIRTGSHPSELPSVTSNSTAIDLTSFDILSSEQPVHKKQPTNIQQHGKIGTNVLAELNRAISQRGGANNSCSSFGTVDNELNIPERTNISTPNYCFGDVQNQNSTTILHVTQTPESDLDMNCFKPPSSQSQNTSVSEAARKIVSLRKSAQLSALRAPAENNRSNPPQQISREIFSQASFNQESKQRTLKLEDKVVWVTDTKAENGTVKWIGDCQGGTAAGIQFERRIGNTDGKFRGKQHFKCPPQHGGYVPITSLMLQSDYYANNSVNFQHSTSTRESAPPESLLFTSNNERDDSESSKTLLYWEEDNTIICAICQDSLMKNVMQDDNGVTTKTSGLITTPCGHLFHGYCLTKWFSTKPHVTMRECPNCMKTMNIAEVIKIFPSVGKP